MMPKKVKVKIKIKIKILVTSRREQQLFISREGKECDRVKLQWRLQAPVFQACKLWGSFASTPLRAGCSASILN
jgi:hypothetical protein